VGLRQIFQNQTVCLEFASGELTQKLASLSDVVASQQDILTKQISLHSIEGFYASLLGKKVIEDYRDN
jgi:hypothetical protein